MGERLVLEMRGTDGKRLATGYYHWSAYTEDAAAFVYGIINAAEELKATSVINGAFNEKLYAIKLLEGTGAGIWEQEKELAEKLYPNETIMVSKDRSSGIISITEDGMEELLNYAEHVIPINIIDENIEFSVLGSVDRWRDDILYVLGVEDEFSYEDIEKSPELQSMIQNWVDSLPEAKAVEGEFPIIKWEDFYGYYEELSELPRYFIDVNGNICEKIE